MKFPEASVELVGTTAIRGIHDGPAAPTVFGAVRICLYPEFGDCVGRDLDDLRRESLIARSIGVVIHAVQLVVVCCAAEPIYVDGALPAAGSDTIQNRVGDAGREQRQVGRRSSV